MPKKVKRHYSDNYKVRHTEFSRSATPDFKMHRHLCWCTPLFSPMKGHSRCTPNSNGEGNRLNNIETIASKSNECTHSWLILSQHVDFTAIWQVSSALWHFTNVSEKWYSAQSMNHEISPNCITVQESLTLKHADSQFTCTVTHSITDSSCSKQTEHSTEIIQSKNNQGIRQA